MELRAATRATQMKQFKILFLSLLFLSNIAASSGKWYFTITPPHGDSFYVGPYKNYSDASDMLGSAIYSHPFACHLGGNCRATGNGFAYPKDYPFPVPDNLTITGEAPVQVLDDKEIAVPRGWYFLFYTSISGSLEQCKDLGQFKSLARTVPGDEIPFYKNKKCPKAPCFSVGFDTACN